MTGKYRLGAVCVVAVVLTGAGCGSAIKSRSGSATDSARVTQAGGERQASASILSYREFPAGVVADVGGTLISFGLLNHKIDVATGGDFYATAKARAPLGLFALPLDTARCMSFVVATAFAHHVRVASPRRLCGELAGAMERQALAAIVSYYWLLGQAREVGTVVTNEEVGSEFAKWKTETLHRESELSSYLGDRGMTEADQLEAIREEVVSRKFERQLEGLQGQGAYGRFEEHAAPEWTAKTTCLPRYAAEGCDDYHEVPGAPSPVKLLERFVGTKS